MDIVCLGELLVDMFPAEIGRRLVDVSAFLPKPGGAPANVAVAASKLEKQSAFLGKVGSDAFGYHLAEILKQQGVDISGIQYDAEARTSLAFIALPDPNKAEFVFYRNPGADMRLSASEIDPNLLSQTKAFHFGSISLIQEPSRGATLFAIQQASIAGSMISFDVNYRPSLWPNPEEARNRILQTIPLCQLVKVNNLELELLTGTSELESGCQSLLDLGPVLAIVTLGSQGSYFQVTGGRGFVDGYQVQTVDATGCGDAFVAGVLSKLIELDRWEARLAPDTLSKALQYANAVGALTATKVGVIPALPTRIEVENFLNDKAIS